MIAGIGVDVVDISDFKTRAERNARFLERTFDPSEIGYCREQSSPWPHFAARFAAKEAVMKALGTGWAKGVSFSDIVVCRNTDGGPYVELKGIAKQMLNEANGRIHLSMSTTKGQATAFAILEFRPS